MIVPAVCFPVTDGRLPAHYLGDDVIDVAEQGAVGEGLQPSPDASFQYAIPEFWGGGRSPRPPSQGVRLVGDRSARRVCREVAYLSMCGVGPSEAQIRVPGW